MAYTSRGIEEMEFTYCYERRQRVGEEPELVQLPWALVRFRDTGEQRKWVMPIPPRGLTAQGGGTALIDPGALEPPTRVFSEVMDNRAFPVADGVTGVAAGPHGVHFFSWL